MAEDTAGRARLGAGAPSVLIVDDDQQFLALLVRSLRYEGFTADSVTSAAAALDYASRRAPDVIVLDIGLPDQDGFGVLRELRRRGDIPVVMLTARDEVTDKVTALEQGADDYVAKPFAFDELVARIRAVLRRRGTGALDRLGYTDLVLDLGSREVSRGAVPVELTGTEFELLVHLVRRARQVQSRAALLHAVWGFDTPVDTNVVDVHIGTLRPIDRVVRAAGAVRDSRDLTQRVSHGSSRDELGRLVAAFNGMLAELDAAYRSLDQSNERMRRFLADCSHELRAPLTRVRTAMDLLSRLGDDEPEFRSRTITAATTETDRMSALVRNLLLLARADAGTTIRRRPVQLAEVLTVAGERAGRMADGVTLHTPAAGEPDGVVVDGDADHLEQMVLILLDNAFKYTPPPGKVRLDTHLADTKVLVTVQDTGLGIQAEDLPHVFDRFYRGRNANAVDGTGLGLAIAQWIAGQHGGHIDVASTPGEGSTFTIHLPLA